MKHLYPILLFTLMLSSDALAQSGECINVTESCTPIQGWRQVGSIQVYVELHEFSSRRDMPDYENNCGWGCVKPDLRYKVHPPTLYSASYNRSGGQTAKSWLSRGVQATNMWVNILSDTRHIENKVLLNTHNIGGWGLNTFDLKNQYSMLLNMKWEAREDDIPYWDPITGDDDFLAGRAPYDYPLSYLAYRGNSRSVRGTTTYSFNENWPYYFNFESSYKIDAIELDLVFTNMQGCEQVDFCEGENMQVRARYKRPFHNGRFRWERSDNNGASWYLITNYGTEVLYTKATNSNVRYRAALVGSYYSYGVNGMPNGYTAYTPNGVLSVGHQVDEVVMEVKDACPENGVGSVRIANISGAKNGQSYRIALLDECANVLGPTATIDSWTPGYLDQNEIIFYEEPGNYGIGVFASNQDNSFGCGLIEPIAIRNSVTPQFWPLVTNVVCHGENGRIDFNRFTVKNGLPPFEFTLRAVNAERDTIAKRISTYYGSLTVPPGSYVVSLENRDGCIYEHPDSVRVLDRPLLSAQVKPPVTYEHEGIIYTGHCASELFEAEVNIAGGTPPYYIRMQAPANVQSRAFRLLPDEQLLRIPDLPEGNYSFEIRDANNCSLSPLSLTFNNPDPISFPQLLSTNPSTDCGMVAQDGSIMIVDGSQTTGGFGTYSYFLNGSPISDFNITGLGNSTNLLEIKDENGCTVQQQIKLQNNAYLNVFAEEFNTYLTCNQGIQLELFAEGGAPSLTEGYTLNVNGVPCADDPNCTLASFYPGDEFYGIPAQAQYFYVIYDAEFYLFEFTDAVGCTVPFSKQYAPPAAPLVTGLSTEPPACVGGIYETTFFIQSPNFHPFDGLVPMDYILDGDTVDVVLNMEGANPKIPYEFTLSISDAGAHSIRLIDEFGCGDPASFNFNLEAIGAFQINIDGLLDPMCYGDSSGIIEFSLTGNAPYAIGYTQNGEPQNSDTLYSNSGSLEALPSGEYEIMVSDARGCEATFENILLYDFPMLQADVNSTSSINCTGTNGVIEVRNIFGGSPPFLFSLNGKAFQSDSTIIGAGLENEIVIQDHYGCTFVKSINLPMSSPSLFPSTIVLEPASECGLGTAVIEVAAGYTHPVQIFKLADTLEYSINTNPNFSDSIVTVSYRDTLEQLSAGEHYFLVRDGWGCEKITTLSIPLTDPLEAMVSRKTDESCHLQSGDGNMTISVTGGIAPYTIELDSVTQQVTNDSSTFNSLSKGNYFVNVTDSRGCSVAIEDSIKSGSLPLLQTNVSNLIGCETLEMTGDINVTPYNGAAPYIVQWEDGSLDEARSALPMAEYAITVSDGNGCSTSTAAYLIGVDSFILSVSNVVDNLCQADSSGSVTLHGFGGFSPYRFSKDGINFQTDSVLTGLPVGNQQVYIKGNQGCLLDTTVAIGFSNPLSASVTTSNENCPDANDGQLSITVSNGVAPFRYSLDGINFQASNNFSGLATGNYTAWVSDGSGCLAKYPNLPIEEPAALTLTTSLVMEASCGSANGAASARAGGGTAPYLYEWDNNPTLNQATLSNVIAGTHNVMVTDAKGCIVSQSISIEGTDLPMLSLENSQPENCGLADGSLRVSVQGGVDPFEYQWSHDSNLDSSYAENLATGNYQLTVTDAAGCMSVLNNLEITATSDIGLTVASFINADCINPSGSITLAAMNGTPPYSFHWSHDASLNSASAIGLGSGNYAATVTDSKGCSASIYQDLISFIGDFEIMKGLDCRGDATGHLRINLEGNMSDYQFEWNKEGLGNSFEAFSLGAGSYIVTVTNTNSCTEVFQATLTEPEALAIDFTEVQDVNCNGVPGSATASAKGGTPPYQYQWNDTQNQTTTTASELNSGDYQLVVSDANGCSLSANVTINEKNVNNEGIDLGNRDTVLCNGDRLHFELDNNIFTNIQWSSLTDGFLSSTPGFSTTGEGTYIVTANDGEDCEVSDSITVNYSEEPLDAFFIAPTDIVAGDTLLAVELSLPVPDSIRWGYDTAAFILLEQEWNQYFFYFPKVGDYELQLTAFSNGCSNHIVKTISVYADSTEIPFVNPLVPTIVELQIFPNPSKGPFTIEVELSADMDMAIDIFNTQSILFDRSVFTGSDRYAKTYELELPTGVYYAIVQVAGVRRSLTFVVD